MHDKSLKELVNQCQLTSAEQKPLLELLSKYSDIFATSSSDLGSITTVYNTVFRLETNLNTSASEAGTIWIAGTSEERVTGHGRERSNPCSLIY